MWKIDSMEFIENLNINYILIAILVLLIYIHHTLTKILNRLNWIDAHAGSIDDNVHRVTKDRSDS